MKTIMIVMNHCISTITTKIILTSGAIASTRVIKYKDLIMMTMERIDSMILSVSFEMVPLISSPVLIVAFKPIYIISK